MTNLTFHLKENAVHLAFDIPFVMPILCYELQSLCVRLKFFLMIKQSVYNILTYSITCGTQNQHILLAGFNKSKAGTLNKETTLLGKTHTFLMSSRFVISGDNPPCTHRNCWFMRAARGRQSKASIHASYTRSEYLILPVGDKRGKPIERRGK